MIVKAILTVMDSGETGGTTTYANGAKAYWNEGRSSETIYVLPDGTIEKMPVTEDKTYYADALVTGELGEMRTMLPAEEVEWHTMRNS